MMDIDNRLIAASFRVRREGNSNSSNDGNDNHGGNGIIVMNRRYTHLTAITNDNHNIDIVEKHLESMIFEYLMSEMYSLIETVRSIETTDEIPQTYHEVTKYDAYGNVVINQLRR